MKTIEAIKNLLEKDREIRHGSVKRNLELVETDLTFLNPILKKWEQTAKDFQRILMEIPPDTLREGNPVHPSVTKFAQKHDQQLDILLKIKKTVVSPDIEPIVSNVQNEISQMLRYTGWLLECLDPDRKSGIEPEKLIGVVEISLSGYDSKIALIKEQIQRKTSSNKYSTDSGKNIITRVGQSIFNQKTQFLLWLFGFLLIVIFQFTSFPLETSIESYKGWAKIFILLTMLWFPLLFIVPKAMRGGDNISIFAVAWSILLAIWAYGFVTGIVISVILFVFPITRLLNSRNLDSPSGFQNRFIKPIAISLFILAFLINREFLWLIGLTLWLTYLVFLRSTSYKFFRQNYDLIEDLYPNVNTRNQRAVFFLGALILSSLLFATGFVGKLEPDFVNSIYSSMTNFALALVTILLAVQAIIPGINVWSQEKMIDKRIREMRFMIRANKGLGGFMSSFFFLLVLSVVGQLITTRMENNFQIAVDLSYQRLFEPITSVFDILNPFTPMFIFSLEATWVSISTILFVLCGGLAIYSFFQLYYLFTTASIFLLPVRDALLSNPVHIEDINVMLVSQQDKSDEIEDFLREILVSNRKLNGYVINKINVINDPDDYDEVRITILLEMDFIELEEIFRLCENTFKTLFDSYGAKKSPLPIRKVGFAVFRDTHDRGRHNVFSLDVDREEWEFLKEDDSQLSFEYKIKHVLKAKIVSYVLPDSQIF